MKYKENYNFNKFNELLSFDNEKEKIYDLYKTLKNESKKKLFLYLLYEPSNNKIKELLNQEGVLTILGVTNYFNQKRIFCSAMEFRCSNFNCEKSTNIIKSKDKILKKCPVCDEKIYLDNKEGIINSFFGLYLNYFEYYILNDIKTTMYIIRNKYNGKTYFKSSDESFFNWLYIKLLENECDVEYFLRVDKMGFGKGAIQNQLKKFFLSYNIIKSIDNINFKPINQGIFKEENKKYLNLYTGNKYLNFNKIENKKDNDYFSKCLNINELLFNLSGKDEKGVGFILDVLAMIIQEPHMKTKQLIIFYGEEASGKGTFYDLILKPLFEGYIIKILGKKIKSSFNGFMSKNLVLVLEEVKADKEEEDTLKELVTEDLILINEKNMPERYENNYLTIFGFSNEQNPISVGNRRGVYFNSRTLGGSIDKAPSYRKRYEKEIPKEFEYFIRELKTRKYDRVETMKGYMTEAKKQVQEQNMSLIQRFFYEISNYESFGRYNSKLIEDNRLDINLDISRFIKKSQGVDYVKAIFILEIYNSYLINRKYRPISLNKFGEFWQLVGIDRSNKKHFNRFSNEGHKETYINLNLLNNKIKEEYNNN